MALGPFSLGPVSVKGKPLVVGVIDRIYPVSDFQKWTGVDVLEVRLDLFDSVPLQDTLAFIRSLRELGQFGLLGTLRETDQNRLIRHLLFEQLLPWVDMVDVEVDSILAHKWVQMARDTGKQVLISDHNYQTMPDDSGLQQFWDAASAFSPDMIKLAAHAATYEDAMRLMQFCFLKATICPMVAIAMGESGQFSRIVGGYFRSYMTYGYLGEVSAAPGQLSAQELVKRFSVLY